MSVDVTFENKRIDVDTHFYPRIDRHDLRGLFPRGLAAEVLDMFDREAQRIADPDGIRAEMRGKSGSGDDGGDAHRDPEVRVASVRELGFDLQVLIPDGPFGNLHGAGPYTVSAPLEVRLAMCQVFNNATGAAQAKFPESFIGTMIVPFDNVEAAAREVRRGATELGLKVVVLPFNWVGKNFDEYALYPLWQEINDLGVTVFCHGITQGCGSKIGDHQPRYPAAFAERMRRLHLGTYMGFGMEYIMATGALTLGGVFDEFPNLRFCFFEAGASWLPYAMYANDRSFLIEPQCSRSQRLPSELIKERCLTAIEPMESINELINIVGNENFFFGTDFPHPEFQVFHAQGRAVEDNEPGAAAILHRSGLSETDKTNILGANIARVLGSK
jgi:predicted TIM-barrel fold metal-dependent hydrolase